MRCQFPENTLLSWLEVPITKSVVHGFAVVQQNDTQIPGFGFNVCPPPNPTIRLKLLSDGMLDGRDDPLIKYTCAIGPCIDVPELFRRLQPTPSDLPQSSVARLQRSADYKKYKRYRGKTLNRPLGWRVNCSALILLMASLGGGSPAQIAGSRSKCASKCLAGSPKWPKRAHLSAPVPKEDHEDEILQASTRILLRHRSARQLTGCAALRRKPDALTSRRAGTAGDSTSLVLTTG